MSKKIIVIGSPGAGKSYFSRKLSEALGLPIYHLDLIWHKPDKTTVSREEFDEMLEAIMAREEWIIDGNYARTLECRLARCEEAFLLDFPLEVCLKGAVERVGRVRSDMPWVEEELDPEFREWIINFPCDTLPKIYELIKKYESKVKIHIFKSREEADSFIESITTKEEK